MGQPTPAGSLGPRFTLGRLMLVIAALSVPLAVIIQVGKQSGWPLALGLAALFSIWLPMIAALPLSTQMAPGPRRNAAMLVLVSAPLIAFSLAASGPMLALAIAAFRFAGPLAPAAGLFLLLCAFAFSLPLIILARDAGPRRCPSCGRLGLVPGLGSRQRTRTDPTEYRWCVRCGTRFKRGRRQPWRPADEPGDAGGFWLS